MQSLIKSALITLALISVMAPAFGAGSEADEKAVWDLWKAHLSSSNNHEAVLAVFQQGQKNASSNSLFAVAQGLCAWHLLKNAKTNEAVQLLEAMLTVDRQPSTVNSLNSAGIEMGQRWLTRIDREKVRNALGRYYRQQIAYPENLQPLKKMPVNSLPPLTDRWNASWIYQLAGFKTIKGLDNQRYLLQSAKLKENSDLKTALAQPYAGTIKIKPVSATASASGAQSIRFESADQKAAVIVLSEGTKLDTVSLVYVGSKIIILSDGDYWLIAPKPRQ